MLTGARMKEMTYDNSSAKASVCWQCTPRRSINIVVEKGSTGGATGPTLSHYTCSTVDVHYPLPDSPHVCFLRYLPSKCTFPGTLLHTNTCVFVLRIFSEDGFSLSRLPHEFSLSWPSSPDPIFKRIGIIFRPLSLHCRVP